MSEVVRYLLVGLIVFFTSFQEGITGFGASALALPFVVLLVDLPIAKYALVIQGWLLAIMIIAECRKHKVWQEAGHTSTVNAPGLCLTVKCNSVWREYAWIALLVGLGLPAGIWFGKHVPERDLKWVLAGFMSLVGIYSLIRQYMGKPHQEMSPRKRALMSVFLPLGGIIHGAFGTGGPLVVVYATRAIADKGIFRVTLCMMWFTMNTIVITQWLLDRHANHPEVFKLLGYMLPFTLVGFVVGNWAHYRANELMFRKVVYSVLTLSGAVLVWSLVR